MNERQWQQVEAIVRKEQEKCLQRFDKKQYKELSVILTELFHYAHPSREG